MRGIRTVEWWNRPVSGCLPSCGDSAKYFGTDVGKVQLQSGVRFLSTSPAGMTPVPAQSPNGRADMRLRCVKSRDKSEQAASPCECLAPVCSRLLPVYILAVAPCLWPTVFEDEGDLSRLAVTVPLELVCHTSKMTADSSFKRTLGIAMFAAIGTFLVVWLS
jgi:hypothetical protein